MLKSIRVRLTLWYTGSLAVILVVFSGGFYSLLEKSLRQRLDGNLRSAGQVTALALNHETEEHEGKEKGEENVRLVLNTMHQTSFPRPDIAVWDGERLVAEKPGTAGVPFTMLPGRERDFPAGDSFRIIERNGVRYRVSVYRARVPYSGTVYRVLANESLQPIEAEMATVLEIIFVTGPVCLLLAAGGGYLLARKSLAPVLRMATTAQQISSQHLDRRLAVENPRDELGRLAKTFNGVFEHLQQAFRQQRQFMADASHELRTPLSVALTAAQVSLSDTRVHPAEELAETLRVIQSQLHRLRRVVEDMFMLAQADSGVFTPTTTTFYLNEVLDESVRAARVLGAAREVEVRVGPVANEIEYTGDEGLLRQLFLILLDNAVKYTPSGGHVELSMEPKADGYRISIADTGPGIPEADQPYIFDRFYRADRSRSRRQPAAGSGAGLGLAIARWIAQLHGGRIWLARTGREGSHFCVELPLGEGTGGSGDPSAASKNTVPLSSGEKVSVS